MLTEDYKIIETYLLADNALDYMFEILKHDTGYFYYEEIREFLATEPQPTEEAIKVAETYTDWDKQRVKNEEWFQNQVQEQIEATAYYRWKNELINDCHS